MSDHIAYLEHIPECDITDITQVISSHISCSVLYLQYLMKTVSITNLLT